MTKANKNKILQRLLIEKGIKKNTKSKTMKLNTKKTILIIIAIIALLATAVYAGQAYRMDTTELTGDFQDKYGVKTYKFTDNGVTCYGQIAVYNGITGSNSISCVKDVKVEVINNITGSNGPVVNSNIKKK